MAAAQNLISGTLGFNPFNVPDDQVVDANGVLNPNATFMWADDTDWEDAIQRTGSRTDIGVSVSGGNNKSDYYLSAGYLTEGGYIIGSKFDRYTLNTNVNSQITSFLKIGGTLSGNISKAEGQQSQASGNNNNPFRFTRYIGPIYPIHVHDPRTKEYVLDAMVIKCTTSVRPIRSRRVWKRLRVRISLVITRLLSCKISATDTSGIN